MAYELYYTAHFTNEQSQLVEAWIYKKDADPPDTVEAYPIMSDGGCTISDQGVTARSEYNSEIITREITLLLYATSDQSITWETFVDAEHDTWKMIVDIDGQRYFEGFILPDEGQAVFQDRPYEVKITATVGLGLLQTVPLSDTSEVKFNGEYFLIAYIAGALKKTGLDLPIRIYCGYFHASMLNKGNSLEDDMFNQAKLDHRTFLKDDINFVSCHDALMIILGKFCRLEYWKGMWVIQTMAEIQYKPADNYFVDYNSDGIVIGSGIDGTNHGQIGKIVDIYPILEDQLISARYAVKSAQTTFRYQIPENLVNNQKLSSLGDLIIPLSGSGYTAHELVGWSKMQGDLTAQAAYGGSAEAYTRTEVDSFNIEADRYYRIETDTAAPGGLHFYIQNDNDNFYVDQNDLIGLVFSMRRGAFDFGDPNFVQVALLAGSDPSISTSWWTMQPDGLWQNNPNQYVVSMTELLAAGPVYMNEFRDHIITDSVIPDSGKLYIRLGAGHMEEVDGNYMDYRPVAINYDPYLKGSRFAVKGHAWTRSQSANFPDTIEDEVHISDVPKRILKGALLFNDQITDPSWYRHGPIGDPNVLDEQRAFIELLNIGRYNHAYRRMYIIEGTFNGLNYSPENDSGNKEPIAFFKRYRMVDMDTVRDFVIVPPLTMDIARGWISATVIEIWASSDDGTREGTATFKYLFT